MILIRITTVPISLRVLLKGQLKFLRNHDFEPIMVSSDGEEVPELKIEQGADHYVIPLTRKITPLKDLIAIVKFYKLCKEVNPVIVHSHTPKAGLVGMIGSRLAGVPVRLHTVAGLPLMESKGLKRRLLELVEKLVYSSATQVYSNSFRLKDFIVENKYCLESKINVIGNGSSNGIDTDFFCPNSELGKRAKKLRADLGISENDFTFVFIGRVVKDKGIVELVTAFVELANEYIDIRLLLVGDFEPDFDRIPDHIMEVIKTHDRIHFVGFQKDVRPYLTASDVLTFPSYREGFPNVPMQAGSMGLPSIVSDINGCNEIVIQDKNGIIVPPKDIYALKKAMCMLLCDRSQFNAMKNVSRQMIVERFDQKTLWNSLLNEYRIQINRIGSV